MNLRQKSSAVPRAQYIAQTPVNLRQKSSAVPRAQYIAQTPVNLGHYTITATTQRVHSTTSSWPLLFLGKVLQIAVRGWGREIGNFNGRQFFLPGEGNLRRSYFDDSNLFQS